MERYTKTAILFHWLIAILIISGFCLGVTMVNIPGLSPTKLKYFSWHKWIGVTVLGLSCLRLLTRLFSQPPAYPDSMSDLQKTGATAMHWLLYFLIFAVPISGYCYSAVAGVPVVYLGIVPLPTLLDPNPELKPILKQVHYWLNVTLLAAFIMHVAAALKHHFVDRDGVLQRMLPGASH
jgi:cytochrome b561